MSPNVQRIHFKSAKTTKSKWSVAKRKRFIPKPLPKSSMGTGSIV